MLRRTADGMISWNREDFTHYVVKGVYAPPGDGKFEFEVSSWERANAVNLYRGTVHGVPPKGRKVLLKTVFN